MKVLLSGHDSKKQNASYVAKTYNISLFSSWEHKIKQVLDNVKNWNDNAITDEMAVHFHLSEHDAEMAEFFMEKPNVTLPLLDLSNCKDLKKFTFIVSINNQSDYSFDYPKGSEKYQAIQKGLEKAASALQDNLSLKIFLPKDCKVKYLLEGDSKLNPEVQFIEGKPSKKDLELNDKIVAARDKKQKEESIFSFIADNVGKEIDLSNPALIDPEEGVK